MTKTAKTRWGKKRVAIEVPPTFNDEQTERLAALLGVSKPKCVTVLQEKLNDAAIYHRLFEEAVSWEKPGEIRAALDEIHQLASTLWLRMIDLPDRTEIALESSYSLSRFGYEEDFADGHIKLERDIKHLQRLSSSIVHARKIVPKAKGGRPHQHKLHVAAVKLGEVYEELTGEKFQVSQKRDRDAAARFVEDALKTIAPEVTDANLRTALRHAVRVLNLRRQNQKPPQKRR